MAKFFKQWPDIEIPSFLDEHWQDLSWNNDACARAVRSVSPLVDGQDDGFPRLELWVEHDDPREREDPESEKFWLVYVVDEEAENDQEQLYIGGSALMCAERIAAKLGVAPLPFGRRELLGEISRRLKVQRGALIDLAFYVRVSDSCIVKITCDSYGYQDQHMGVRLDVLSKSAHVDSTFIRFDVTLKRAPDDRPDYRGGLHISSNRDKEDWYIARPASLDPLIKLIKDFLMLWTTP